MTKGTIHSCVSCRSFILASRTHSFKRYCLRSSTCAPREHLMEDPERQNISELWTDGMDGMLAEILYQETVEGKFVWSKITNEDHVRIAKKMSQVGRRSIDASLIWGRCNQLRQRLRLFTNLLSQPGMVWNQQTKTVVATGEHWARALSVHGQWRKFKTNGCPNYDLLCTIFGQPVATGVLLEEEARARGPVLGTAMDAPIDIGSPYMSGAHVGQGSFSGVTRRRAREPIRDSCSFPQFSRALEVMATGSAARTELEHKMFDECMSKRSKGKDSSQSEVSFSKMAQCIKLLDQIHPRLSPEQYNKASLYFLQDKMQDMFLCIPRSADLIGSGGCHELGV